LWGKIIVVTIYTFTLKKPMYRKSWYKLSIPAFFKPVFKGKKIVAIEVKTKTKSREYFEQILEEKGVLCRIL